MRKGGLKMWFAHRNLSVNKTGGFNSGETKRKSNSFYQLKRSLTRRFLMGSLPRIFDYNNFI